MKTLIKRLQKEPLQLSYREFIEKYIIDDTWYAAFGIKDEEERRGILNRVVKVLPKRSLQDSIKQARIRGISPKEFIERFITDDAWLSALGIKDEEERKGASIKLTGLLASVKEFILSEYYL